MYLTAVCRRFFRTPLLSIRPLFPQLHHATTCYANNLPSYGISLGRGLKVAFHEVLVCNLMEDGKRYTSKGRRKGSEPHVDSAVCFKRQVL